MSHIRKIFLASTLALILSGGCKDTQKQDSQRSDNKIKSEQTESKLTSYPLKRHFECLPDSAAIIAAHRGSSKRKGLAENAKRGLEALINHGTLIAEIDVAKSKDGVHFLFHDGVWEKDTTGKGVVAATGWEEAQKFLLNDTSGKLTSETLISLDDYLKLAKDNIYLEIDFKSSAVYETVIDMIRSNNMSDQVILISYSSGQARKLARLAPEMIVSVSINSEKDLKNYRSQGLKDSQIAAWTGRNGPSKTLSKTLGNKSIPVLTFPAREQQSSLVKRANLIVSDYALNQKPIIGKYDKQAYKACLNQ